MEILLFGFLILLRNLAQEKGRQRRKTWLENVWISLAFYRNINNFSETFNVITELLNVY